MQSTLVFAEHDGAKLNPSTRHAITAAKAIGGDISALVAGPKCGDVAKEVAAIGGLSKVRLAMRANIDSIDQSFSEPVPIPKFGHVRFF